MAEDWVWRRFGSAHDKPCNDPKTITCAMPKCQIADKCRKTCGCPQILYPQPGGKLAVATLHSVECVAARIAANR